MPLSEVDNELTCSVSSWSQEGRQVVKALGSCFALMFDGWSHGPMYYVAAYAVFEADGAVKLQLLALCLRFKMVRKMLIRT
ncbi:hypothetical protein PHMEG_00039376 [Phytophthora megakarya]|uniref:Uncharacterized protein n=1 Tax=Phytophthora megakarya TaxID=4795 RepID=A0A225UH12_9STRA|nr:hypothetical protein PHMEG_00039376 [Phytophthora megakarya]